MAKRRATGRPRPLGFTQDMEAAALAFDTPHGEFTLEIGLDDLPAWQLLAAQVHDKSREVTGVDRDPALLPVWKFELGHGDGGAEGPIVVMRLHIPGGGSFGFRLLQSFALEMQDALREACGLHVERTHKPN